MTRKLKSLGKYRSTFLLAAMTLFCLSLWLVRYLISGTNTFRFLHWNLFLAFVPWALSSILLIWKVKNKVMLPLLLVSWLLFLPNAPYIFTDLIHLRERPSAPYWYDMVLILSYAWTGLMFGIMSIIDIEKVAKKYVNGSVSNLMVFGVLFLSSFGIYLGRFLRLNTWDVVSNPMGVLASIGRPFLDPITHWRVWGVTLLMGILLNMMYFSIKLLRAEHHKNSVPSDNQ